VVPSSLFRESVYSRVPVAKRRRPPRGNGAPLVLTLDARLARASFAVMKKPPLRGQLGACAIVRGLREPLKAAVGDTSQGRYGHITQRYCIEGAVFLHQPD
jgi:hypothetical protein